MSFININSNNAMAFSDEQSMIQESARAFCQDQSSIEDVRKLLDSKTGFQAPVWQQMIDLGWTGICIDEQHGGLGLGLENLIPIAESMGRHLLSTPFFSSTLASQLLQRSNDASQQALWLNKIAAGSVATLALLDDEDWGASSTHCNISADGVLSGKKVLVHDAEVAELFIVHCQQDGSEQLALVSATNIPEGAIQLHSLIDETKRAAVVDFSGIKVDAILDCSSVDALLSEVKLIGALLTASEAVGATASCLNLTVEYLKTRKQFGKLIGSYQALKHPAVDILNMMEGARSQIYHAATVLADTNGKIDQDVEIACRMSKATANDALLFAGDRAVQFHGGMGFTYECDAQLYIRRAQWSQQQFGDSAHHRKRLGPLLLGC